MTVVRIHSKMKWSAFRDPVTKYWVAVCDPLKLTVQGETWRALLESISDTIDLVFKDLVATGELEQFLETHGWRRQGEVPAKPTRVRFDVPFVVTRQNAGYAHHTETALCK